MNTLGACDPPAETLTSGVKIRVINAASVWRIMICYMHISRSNFLSVALEPKHKKFPDVFNSTPIQKKLK